MCLKRWHMFSVALQATHWLPEQVDKWPKLHQAQPHTFYPFKSEAMSRPRPVPQPIQWAQERVLAVLAKVKSNLFLSENLYFFLDLKKTPGPGTYNTTDPSVYRFRQHVYSMTGRNLQPGDSTQKPGPGAHSPEKVKINRRATASYSFGIRHSDYVAPFVERIRDR